jgi:hypothetical protein
VHLMRPYPKFTTAQHSASEAHLALSEALYCVCDCSKVPNQNSAVNCIIIMLAQRSKGVFNRFKSPAGCQS